MKIGWNLKSYHRRSSESHLSTIKHWCSVGICSWEWRWCLEFLTAALTPKENLDSLQNVRMLPWSQLIQHSCLPWVLRAAQIRAGRTRLTERPAQRYSGKDEGTPAFPRAWCSLVLIKTPLNPCLKQNKPSDSCFNFIMSVLPTTLLSCSHMVNFFQSYVFRLKLVLISVYKNFSLDSFYVVFLLLSVEKRKLGLIWRKPPLPPSAYFNQNGIEDGGKKNQMHEEMIFTRREIYHGSPEAQDCTHFSTFHILVLLLHPPGHTSRWPSPALSPSLPAVSLLLFTPNLWVFFCVSSLSEILWAV